MNNERLVSCFIQEQVLAILSIPSQITKELEDPPLAPNILSLWLQALNISWKGVGEQGTLRQGDGFNIFGFLLQMRASKLSNSIPLKMNEVLPGLWDILVGEGYRQKMIRLMQQGDNKGIVYGLPCMLDSFFLRYPRESKRSGFTC